jgi:hypothetical protein
MILTAALALGYVAAGRGLAPNPPPAARTHRPTQTAQDRVAAHRLFWVNALFLAVTALWVFLTMRAAGGPAAFIRLAGLDPIGARDLLLDRKLFTGMRLLYAGLPATAALAAALLARGGLAPRTRALCIAVIAGNLVALFLLTLVMSQRLLLMQLVVAVFVAASVARGRILGLWLIPLAAFVFASGWTLHEALTNPGLARSATEIAAQKFAFYAVNDLWNTARPLIGDAPRGGGLFTFQFALFFSLTDGIVYAAHADTLTALLAYRGGGEFSLLSAPYVDFGLPGAALYLVLYGAIVRILWHRAGHSAGDAAIYGQVATALLLSVHANFAASQDFIFALLVILVITRLPSRSLRAQPAAGPQHAAA